MEESIMFKKNFTVIEHKNGKTYETHLSGKRQEILKDIQAFKDVNSGCKMVETSKRLVIWDN